MDVDDPLGGSFRPATRRKPPGLDEVDGMHDEPMLSHAGESESASEATSDPWQGFQRAPRAFGCPGGVREVEPGGALERLVEEWTIDDRPHGAAAVRGPAAADESGGWLGRLTTGWRSGGAASFAQDR